MVFRVIVIGPDLDRSLVDLCDTEEQFKTITVLQLKEKIRERFGYKPDTIRLIFTGRYLSESTLLYSVSGEHHHSSEIQCVEIMGQCTSCQKNNAEMMFKVIVIGPRGWRWFIDLCDTEKQFKTITVLQLKEKIRKRCGYKPDDIRLVFSNETLSEDSTLLYDYGIRHMSQIHVELLPGEGELPRDEKDRRWKAFIESIVLHGSRYWMSEEHVVRELPEGGPDPEKEDGGMGDKEKSRSMELVLKF
ncbi:uncharacterized protein LOC103358426 [Stegastes partitus]|uniref:Uncharacterized protein LOC103358426 n=1 Tax=Stegastes partitus TaxID=144197 RepID=A0A9Y4JUL5_9TELE|nr:PREDICTED: uncharacterized protein LOC103358426 [Stegastes partitus]